MSDDEFNIDEEYEELIRGEQWNLDFSMELQHRTNNLLLRWIGGLAGRLADLLLRVAMRWESYHEVSFGEVEDGFDED